jgi:fused signal recognition particle receptor
MLKRGIFKRLFQKVDQIVTGRGRVDEELFDDFEEALLAADLSVHTTDRVLEDLRGFVRDERLPDAEAVRERLAKALTEALGDPGDTRLAVAGTPPTLYLMVGVNGVGKTTTCAKLAHREIRRGGKVILAAGDTFRAAAADQLGLWAERVGADFIRHRENSDPAAVVFDALQAARARRADLVIVDTAGRLHTKTNLMEELKKIGRVAERELSRKPDEVLLTLDATTGQNAIRQAKEFVQTVGVTGIVLAKLDGTARGGIVITIRDELGIPIKLVGTGEKAEDLQEFDPRAFVDALLATD